MSWKCEGGYCFECGPEDPPINCPYADLGECIADSCASPTYDCLNFDCTFAELHGFYLTLELCEAACGDFPTTPTYNCVSEECVDPGDGSGEYETLAECEAECLPGTPSWECVDDVCSDPGDGSGPYATEEECEEFCLGDDPIPLGCAEYVDEYHRVRRRAGCSTMFPLYLDTSEWQIEKKTTTCDEECTAFLQQYEDLPDEYVVTRGTGDPPCLCVLVPEDCDPSGVVLTASVTSTCSGLNGEEFDLTYDGTDCGHTWSGEFVAPNGCVLAVEVGCTCCELSASFTYGTIINCPPGQPETTYQCQPMLITMAQEGCDYEQNPPGTNCGTCDITVVVTE